METDFAAHLHDVMARNMWGVYLCLLIAPFVQEDAAVIGAASLSLGGMGDGALLFAVVAVGLIASDLWKYWLGRAARRHHWAHKFAEKPGVSVAGDLVRKEFLQTMLTARFVPGTRIPTYVACGFFKAEYLRYVLVLILTAALYVGITFSLFHTIGAVAGEQAKFWLPAIAIGLLVVYVAYRWISHLNNKRGPMTPLTDAQDHPMPEMPGFEGNPLEADDNHKKKE